MDDKKVIVRPDTGILGEGERRVTLDDGRTVIERDAEPEDEDD